MRTSKVVGVLFMLVALGSGTAGATQDPYRAQAEKIVCPSAPPGWFNPTESAGGRTVLTPLTAVVQPTDPTELFGAPVVEVDCQYMTAAGKDIQVAVRYALPIDINPWNDFDIGCTVTGHPADVATSAHAWDDRDRIYRVVGAKTWSLATFIDDLHQLAGPDVPRFEAIANAMLSAAQPFAHNCKLAGGGGPVDVKSIWIFSFDARTSASGTTSTGSTSGSFVTTPSSSPDVGTITDLFANNFRLGIRTGSGKPWTVELHVGDPIAFRYGYGSLLRARLLVVASNDPGCAKGSAGTLVLSVQTLTPPRVAVELCGRTFLDGKGQVSVQMKTV